MASYHETTTVLAKKPQIPAAPQYQETLRGHTEYVVKAFDSLFGGWDHPTRLAVKWLSFFGLDIEKHGLTFVANGLASCAWHDIGKANSCFQEAVRGNSHHQVIRHEHLSGLIAWYPRIKELLINVDSLDYDLLFCSVIGHHLKADHATFAVNQSADLFTFDLLKDGIQDVLDIFVKLLCLEKSILIHELPIQCSFKKGNEILNQDVIEKIKKQLYKFKHGLLRDEEKSRLLRAIRASVILADSAGSGIIREGYELYQWISSVFDDRLLLKSDDIEAKVIQPRIKQIERERGIRFHWADFQESAERLTSRALFLAPCGSGKTLAAWRWIKAQAHRAPIARVIFLYPTRATATEGFRDYVSWAPESDAALVHGTSEYELQGMFDNPHDSRCGKDFTVDDRLYALGYWQRRIFSATVDQFLGFLQHSYRSTCLLPLLADSVIVIDEVHSFDQSLFSSLRLFLLNFQVPVLCMTASLPEKRKQYLDECGLEVFPMEKSQFADIQKKSEMPRYSVALFQSRESIEERLSHLRNENPKILWVVNTVQRCQELANRYEDALCYHSRYKMDHRKQHHNELIGRFKRPGQSILAITTQVCEMSLDLDADVLITEEAPITSLIQRMGRCNRRQESNDGRLGKVLIYPPENLSPYSKEDVKGVQEFLGHIDGRIISQSILEELLDHYGPSEPEPARYSGFLDSGPWAMSREESLRDENDFTVPAILDSEIEAYIHLCKKRKPVEGLIVNVPRRYATRNGRIGSWPLVAPSSQYDERLGFLDASKEYKR